MPSRQQIIAKCVIRAVAGGTSGEKKRSLLRRLLVAILAFLRLWRVALERHRPDVFERLRTDVWQIDDPTYTASFAINDGNPTLQQMGDMGYSGSTFYTTEDEAFLVKSIPRQFEHSFFREDLMEPYAEHMTQHPDSALVRICDFLGARHTAIGVLLGLAPSHHLIMENLLAGQSRADAENKPKWETWDLKPTSYFFPERDIAGGRLASEDTKARLADEFNDKLILSQEQADEFERILDADTRLLQECNAVDYSLFLVRITVGDEDPFADPAVVADHAPLTPPAPPSWRTGIESPDGKHVYRAVILDFFWAKHKLQPRVMTGLIKLWNLLDRQGPMSITTTAEEYRSRFLKMSKGFIEVVPAQDDD